MNDAADLATPNNTVRSAAAIGTAASTPRPAQWASSCWRPKRSRKCFRGSDEERQADRDDQHNHPSSLSCVRREHRGRNPLHDPPPRSPVLRGGLGDGGGKGGSDVWSVAMHPCVEPDYEMRRLAASLRPDTHQLLHQPGKRGLACPPRSVDRHRQWGRHARAIDQRGQRFRVGIEVEMILLEIADRRVRQQFRRPARIVGCVDLSLANCYTGRQTSHPPRWHGPARPEVRLPQRPRLV